MLTLINYFAYQILFRNILATPLLYILILSLTLIGCEREWHEKELNFKQINSGDYYFNVRNPSGRERKKFLVFKDYGTFANCATCIGERSIHPSDFENHFLVYFLNETKTGIHKFEVEKVIRSKGHLKVLYDDIFYDVLDRFYPYRFQFIIMVEDTAFYHAYGIENIIAGNGEEVKFKQLQFDNEYYFIGGMSAEDFDGFHVMHDYVDFANHFVELNEGEGSITPEDFKDQKGIYYLHDTKYGIHKYGVTKVNKFYNHVEVVFNDSIIQAQFNELTRFDFLIMVKDQEFVTAFKNKSEIIIENE